MKYNPAHLNHSTILKGLIPTPFVDLAFPSGVSFPVTFQRNNMQYRIKELAADFFADYSGNTIQLADGGDLNAAIIAASAGDIIELEDDGIYAFPATPIDKKIAIVCPNGRAHIGTFNDMSGSTITSAAGDLYNASKDLANSYRGFVRRDGTKIGGFAGSARSSNNTICAGYQADGIQATFTAGGSTNFAMGNSDSLADEVAAGNILAWTTGDTDSLELNAGAEVFIGANVVLASYATNVINCDDDAILYMNGEAYGGIGTLRHDGDGLVILFESCVMGGSAGDVVDYKTDVKFIEQSPLIGWGGSTESDNASTGHDDCIGLRCGGIYKGSSRVVHDVNRTKTFNFNLTIEDARFNDRVGLLAGFSSIASENGTMDYGQLRFSGNLVNTLFDTAEYTITNTELTDAWPY